MAVYDEKQERISLNADASIGIRTGVPGLPGSADPNGGKQFYFVDIKSASTAGLVASAGTDAVGVLQNKPQHVGDAASVAISGVSLVVCGTGGLTAGAKVCSDATGKAVAVASTEVVLGRCLEPAAAGELAVVLLRMN